MVESCDGVYSEESNEIIGAIAQTPMQKRKKERKGQHNYLFASLSVRSFQLYLPQHCLFSHLFFFFCFQTESPFFFVFASLLPTSVKLRTRLAWSTYLQRNAKKKKKNNSNSNKGACRSSVLIIPSTLSSSCVPFSPFLRKSPIQSFFFYFLVLIVVLFCCCLHPDCCFPQFVLHTAFFSFLNI